MNISSVFFAFNKCTGKTITFDNLYEYIAHQDDYSKLNYVLHNEEFEFYNSKFRLVDIEQLKRAIAKSGRYWELGIPNPNPRRYRLGLGGYKIRGRCHYFRHIKTFQERKMMGALKESEKELKEAGFTKGIRKRRQSLPNEWDDIHHARRGNGWKNYRTTQYK